MGRYQSIFFTLAVFFSGCKNDSGPNPVLGTPPGNQVKTCLLLKANHTNGGYTSYEYDESSRIKSLIQFIPQNEFSAERRTATTFERDSKNRVSKIFWGIESGDIAKMVNEFEYDANSRWTKTTSSSIPASKYYTVTVPDYNSQGQVEKITQTSYNGTSAQVRSRTYEYKDGNLNSFREIQGSRISTSFFEYYLDRPRRITELDSLDSYDYGLGTLSKNMVKSIRTFDQASVMETSYTYVFMDPDYVQMLTLKTVLDGRTVGNIEIIKTYNCK